MGVQEEAGHALAYSCRLLPQLPSTMPGQMRSMSAYWSTCGSLAGTVNVMNVAEAVDHDDEGPVHWPVELSRCGQKTVGVVMMSCGWPSASSIVVPGIWTPTE